MSQAQAGGSPVVGLRLKATYASGQAVDSVVQVVVGMFLLFYLTSVRGMSGSAAGAVFLVSLVIDGVLDPYIGRLSDNWRSRWGRRFPFMAASLPFIAGSIWLMFSLPPGVSEPVLFAVVLLLNVILRVSLSFYMLPHAAITAELTSDYRERSNLSVFRAIFIVLGTAAPLTIAFTAIFSTKDGLQAASGYPILGACAALLIALFGLSCLVGAGRAIIHLPKPAVAEGAVAPGFLRDLLQLARNPSFAPLFIGAVIVLVAQGALNALNLHAYRYFWKLPDALVQLPLLMLPVGMLLGTAGAGLLLRRYEKRDGVIGGILAVVAVQVTITMLRLSGVVPGGSTGAIALVVVNGLVFGAVGALLFVCFYSMIADAVDEHDQLFGVRREALYAAALMLGAKAATGLGSFVAGLGLQLVGFSATSAQTSAAISPSLANGVGLLWGVGSALLMIAAVPLFRLYRIDRQRHAEIVADLAEARGRIQPIAAS